MLQGQNWRFRGKMLFRARILAGGAKKNAPNRQRNVVVTTSAACQRNSLLVLPPRGTAFRLVIFFSRQTRFVRHDGLMYRLNRRTLHEGQVELRSVRKIVVREWPAGSARHSGSATLADGCSRRVARLFCANSTKPGCCRRPAAEAEAGREASGMRCRCQRTSRAGRLRGLVETAEQRRLWTEMVVREHARGAVCHAGHQLRYRLGAWLAGRGRVRRSSAAPCGAGRLTGQGDASATSASRPRHEPLPARPAGTSRRPAFA